jgi:hypothetical protein
MTSVFQKFLFLIWPPYEAYIASKHIAEGENQVAQDVLWNHTMNEFIDAISDELPLTNIKEEALTIQEREKSRKDTIEQKASWLSGSMGLSVAIISVIPAFLDPKWDIPKSFQILASSFYLLSLINFIVGAYYSVLVRKVSAYYGPSIESLIGKIKNGKWDEKKNIAITLTESKWNEKTITKKINYLSVAESLFLRGIAFVAISVIILLFNVIK